MIGFHLTMEVVPTPKRYPDLYWVANNAICFAFFSFVLAMTHCVMAEESMRE